MTEPRKPDLPHDLWGWMTKAGDEWVLVGVVIGGMHTPLVFGSERIAKDKTVREVAINHGIAAKQPVRLVHFKADGYAEAFPGPKS